VTVLVAMLLLGAVCWIFRIMLIALVPADRLPRTVRQALGQLAPAVLAALVAVDAGAATRRSDVLTAVLVVGSLVIAGLAVRLTGSLLLGIGIGIGAALVIDLLILA
jgi:branched-subunit amino acid transport protein